MFRKAVLLVNKATSRGVSGSTFVALAYLRTPWMLAFVCGALLNAAIGKTLKYTLNAKRPENSKLTSPGMPSSHSQSLFYFATALSLAASSAPSTKLPFHWLLVPAFTYFYSITVAYARIFLTQVHNVPQVAVGAALGTAFAIFWTTNVLATCDSSEILNASSALCGLTADGSPPDSGDL